MSVASLHLPATRSELWQEYPGFGVYVHVPFCVHRCHYCDFNTYEGQDELHPAYVDAVVRDVERWEGSSHPATSVFFGGGTPSLLSPGDLARILRAVEGRVGLERDAEITVEVNPETVDEKFFEGMLEVGFNRFSLGVQSLVPRVLLGLGRTHSPATALRALAAARRAGADDLNADLIYGSPWEQERDWLASLEGVLDAGPDHISAYALTIEERTPLATLVATGRVPDVDPDVQADRYEVAENVLGSAGFERYEISNWARPGRASRHNVLYWSAGDYLGFGAGAHGHSEGRRWWSTRLPRDYIASVESGSSTESGSELLAGPQRGAEALVLGLRLASGVHEGAFSRRFGPDVLAERDGVITELCSTGLLVRDGGWLRLSHRATFVSNEVTTRLM